MSKELIEKFLPLTRGFDPQHGWADLPEAARECTKIALEHTIEALKKTEYEFLLSANFSGKGKDEIQKIFNPEIEKYQNQLNELNKEN